MELLARRLIRDVPDFPREGILFKDITPALENGPAFREVMDRMLDHARQLAPDAVVGIESRGFIFAAPLALALGAGFVPVRKLGKLPGDTIQVEYALEYGTNTVEVHSDAIRPGQRVLIVDDLLATGGTSAAAVELVTRLGGQVIGCLYLVELAFLNGRELLDSVPVTSLITY
jgi:adenine phosphoribosyltransferase